jgi:two-component system, NarL family, response regulator NreC
VTPIRIFLADDHAVVRAGVRMLLEREADMVVVGEAGDGRAATRRVAICRPDVLVIDRSTPHLNGMRTIAELRRACPQLRVIVLSRQDDLRYRREALAAGAQSYVLKCAPARVLLQAIRAVAAPESSLP